MNQPKVTFVQFMRLVLDALEEAKVPYMIGGAVCLWAWGAIRTTQDFDVAINLPFKAIHLYSGHKAELFLQRPNDPYREVAFARRRTVDLEPLLMQVYVQAPEDLIIYKLRYYQLSEQPKHMRDIKSILEAMGESLDYTYMNQWIHYFNLSSAWRQAQEWNENA